MNSSLDNRRKHADVFETPGDHDVWETLPDQRKDNEANNEVYLVINGPFRGSSCGTGRATRRWLQP